MKILANTLTFKAVILWLHQNMLSFVKTLAISSLFERWVPSNCNIRPVVINDMKRCGHKWYETNVTITKLFLKKVLTVGFLFHQFRSLSLNKIGQNEPKTLSALKYVLISVFLTHDDPFLGNFKWLNDNEYASFIDIYFYEFSQPSQTSSACAPNIWDTLSDVLESVYASL